MSDNLIEVRNLKKYFNVSGKTLKAVDDISISIGRGETFGLVGESGCGKTTAGRTIIHLYEPTAGEVCFEGEKVGEHSSRSARQWARRMQIIFQDPYASLNPRLTVGDIIGEALDIHGLAKGSARRERITELLSTVGLNSEHANRFPHEFSGGQRQRIGIARALAVDPAFVVCDEPISALDVSIQAQVVNLLKRLQRDRGLTYLFIAHDLSMVKYISDRVGVMYLGKLVEVAPSSELYHHPLHPYTQALLSAIPIPDPAIERTRHRTILEGDVPSPLNPPSGCRFRNRCPRATPICAEADPAVKSQGDHVVSCHLY